MQRWDNKLWLFTPEEYVRLPDGIELTSISGGKRIKGKHHIDMETRFGHIAFGLSDPVTAEEAELFVRIRLSI